MAPQKINRKTGGEDLLRSVWNQYGRAILAVLVVALLMHDIFGKHGFLAMRRTKHEMEQVQTNLDRLNQENQKLADQIKELKSDPQKIEAIARDELGLAKPGEIIIKIPPGQQPEQSPSPKP
jgi:cell division protein FtsL